MDLLEECQGCGEVTAELDLDGYCEDCTEDVLRDDYDEDEFADDGGEG